MIIRQVGQVLGLALFLLANHVPSLLAHALPGSTFIFSYQDSKLELMLSIPLEDLMIASPELEQLDEIGLEQDLSAEQLEILTAYFADHFAIKQGKSKLLLALKQATIELDENVHVGQFKLLVIDWIIKLEGNDPLSLIYDAVMHEVRNHRARIYWSTNGAPANGVREFGYRPIDDTRQLIVDGFGGL